MSGIDNPAFDDSTATTDGVSNPVKLDGIYLTISLNGSTNGIKHRHHSLGAISQFSQTPDLPKMIKDEKHLCGYGRCTPTFLQYFHNPKCLLASLCLCSITQGIVLNGILPVSISTLEKRFHLSSTKMGVFAAMYDVAVLLVLVIVCHYGGHGHKGRWLGFGIIIMGLGSLICTIPQFATGVYKFGVSLTDTCSKTGVSEPCSSDDASLSNYFYVLLLGQILHGLGAAPLYTLGITYLDENVAQKTSAIYLGIFLACSVLGPAIGFIVGGKFLDIYGDIGKVNLADVHLTPSDPRWYGAWWLGFLIAGCMALVFAIPLLGFARELPGASEQRKKDVDQANRVGGATDTTGFGGSLSNVPKQCLELLKNPTFSCLVVMQCCEGFLMNGFTTFVPKVMENLFSLPSSTASLITGALVVPGGFFGNIIGSVVIKKARLRCGGMLVFATVLQAITLVLMFIFLAQCPEQKFAGANTPYSRTSEELQIANIDHACNKDCSCSKFYNPVCSQELGMLYFSPCHAGCRSSNSSGVSSTFTDCECLKEYNTSVQNNGVTAGFCDLPCGGRYYAFLFIFGVLVLVTFTCAQPIQQAVLRCVPFEQRNLAVGLNWIFIRLFGSIPGAILFGLAIDKACIMWAGECTATSCVRYSSRQMSLYLMAFGLSFKFVMVASLALARWFYRAPSHVAPVPSPVPLAVIADKVPPLLEHGSSDTVNIRL